MVRATSARPWGVVGMSDKPLGESGSWRSSRAIQFDADRWATKIRALAVSVDGSEPTVGVLLLRLYGSDLNVRRVHGVAPGLYVVKFGRVFPGGDCDAPIAVSLARHQRPQELTLACARACARYGMWAFAEVWTFPELEAVAMALAIPRSRMSESIPVSELARLCCVDPEIVLQRQRLLTGHATHDSGERPAIAG